MLSASINDIAVHSFGHKLSGACCGGNSQTRWWTPEVRDAIIGLYYCWIMLACGILAVDRYLYTKQATAWVILEAKTQFWEYFSKAMEKGVHSASKGRIPHFQKVTGKLVVPVAVSTTGGSHFLASLVRSTTGY